MGSGQTPHYIDAATDGVLTVLTGPDRVLTVIGEVDLANVEHFVNALEPLRAAGQDVHLRLGRLRFIDLPGAAALVQLAVELHPKHRLVLHSAPEALKRIFAALWPTVPGIVLRDL
jgi:anti-anti-sigma regulatory factor